MTTKAKAGAGAKVPRRGDRAAEAVAEAAAELWDKKAAAVERPSVRMMSEAASLGLLTVDVDWDGESGLFGVPAIAHRGSTLDLLQAAKAAGTAVVFVGSRAISARDLDITIEQRGRVVMKSGTEYNQWLADYSERKGWTSGLARGFCTEDGTLIEDLDEKACVGAYFGGVHVVSRVESTGDYTRFLNERHRAAGDALKAVRELMAHGLL